MNTIISTVITSLLLFMLPIAAYQAYKILLMDSCDPKFGCWGNFELSLLIGVAYWFVSLCALLTVQLLSKVHRFNLPGAMVTILLGTVHWFVFSMAFLDSLIKQILFWLLLSGVFYSLAALSSKKYHRQS